MKNIFRIAFSARGDSLTSWRNNWDLVSAIQQPVLILNPIDLLHCVECTEHANVLQTDWTDSASLCCQNTMNLPPDKVEILSHYDNEKKWDLICDQVGVSVTSLIIKQNH